MRERPAPRPKDSVAVSGEARADARDTPVLRLTAGARLGPYVLQRALVEGPLAHTWQAEDTRDGRPCALKLVPVAAAIQAGALDGFLEQHRILIGLDHPGLRRSHELFRIEIAGLEHAVVVQEFVYAESIGDQLRRGLRFDEQRARQWLREMLDVLDYLHGHSPQVLHCDLNPSNILLPPGGRPVLIDFDLAHGRSSDDAGAGTWLQAAPGYAAPELLVGQPEPASDVYALGMTLVAVLSHRRPLELPHEGERVLFEPFVHVSAAFLAIVRRMTEPELGKRFRSAADVRAALEEVTRAGKEAPARALALSRWKTAAAGLALAVAIGAAALLPNRGSEVPAERVAGTSATTWSAPPAVIRNSVMTWASGVRHYSSQYSDEGWSARRALGAPDVYPNGGDIPGAWASRSPDEGHETLELTFDAAQPSRSIVIVETYNAGAIVRIDDISPGQEASILWEGPARRHQHPRLLLVSLPRARKITALRLVLDSKAAPGWNEIDAVGLIADGKPLR